MPADLERSHCEALFMQLSVLRLRSPQREDFLRGLEPIARQPLSSLASRPRNSLRTS